MNSSGEKISLMNQFLSGLFAFSYFFKIEASYHLWNEFQAPRAKGSNWILSFNPQVTPGSRPD